MDCCLNGFPLDSCPSYRRYLARWSTPSDALKLSDSAPPVSTTCPKCLFARNIVICSFVLQRPKPPIYRVLGSITPVRWIGSKNKSLKAHLKSQTLEFFFAGVGPKVAFFSEIGIFAAASTSNGGQDQVIRTCVPRCRCSGKPCVWIFVMSSCAFAPSRYDGCGSARGSQDR